MKTCSTCNIEVDDDEIFCPKCGEMLTDRSPGGVSDGRGGGGFSLPPQPEPMSVSDVVLGRRYGKRIISSLRTIATIISCLTAAALLACGVLAILGKNPLKLPEERQMLIGILALPAALIAGFLLYFIFNIAITKYENLSLVGRNTEAQLSLLENQSQLISALLDAMNENNRRVDVIGEMLDDVLRLEEKQIRTISDLSARDNNDDDAIEERVALDESISLLNENLCNGAANTQTMLRRVESAVSSGLGKLYRMWYSALNKGEEPPEDDVPSPAAKTASARKQSPSHSAKQSASVKPAAKPDARPAARPEPKPETKPEPRPEPAPAPEPAAYVEPTAQPEPQHAAPADPLDEMDRQSSGELLLGDDDYDLDAIITEAASDSNSTVSYLPVDNN